MITERVPLAEEPISGTAAVADYDRYAWRYMLPEYRYFVRKILNSKIRRGRVLDIGTGSGWLAVELARAKNSDFEITGLDISQDMLNKAGENILAAGLEDKVSLVRGTASSLPFPDHSFDLVVSYASLHHWNQPVEVFDEALRVVKEDGTIIIRDNRRIFGDFWLEAWYRLISLFISSKQRARWPKSIMASYTLEEARSLLDQSKIKGYRLNTDLVKLDICITRGPRKK